MLLVLAWVCIAVAVTAWALRARRSHRLDLTDDTGALDLTEVVDVTEAPVDDWRRLR